MFLLQLLIALLGLAPFIGLFLDYHKRSNIHKAVLFIMALFVTIGTIAWLGRSHYWALLLGMSFATPMLVFLYVLVARSRK